MKQIRKYEAALIQMDTQNDKGENLKKARRFIEEAAAHGAKLICFPEVMNLIGKNTGEGGGREEVPGYTSEILCEEAKKHGVYIHAGSITEQVPGQKRSRNLSFLINPEGEIIAGYRKLHMFDITLSDGTPFRESDRVQGGEEIVTAETELGVFGMSVCYDVRFPELYRLMALSGAQVIFVPSSFTMPTGKDHWEPLLRARAIENGCYIIAAGQTGTKPAYTAYGNSLVADPWGTVIARARDEECITYAQIDLDYLDKIREQLPSLENRRTDVYEVIYKKGSAVKDR